MISSERFVISLPLLLLTVVIAVRLQTSTPVDVTQCSMLDSTDKLVVFAKDGGNRSLCSRADDSCLEVALDTALSSDSVTLWIPPGRWRLNVSVIRTNVSNVNIVGSCDGSTTVACEGSAGMALVNVVNLSLSHISFEGCGIGNKTIMNISDLIEPFVNFSNYRFSENIPISLLIAYSDQLRLTNLSFTGGRSIALMLMNPFGDTVISNTSFTNITSNMRTSMCTGPDTNPEMCTTGGMLVFYGEDGPDVSEHSPHSNVSVDGFVVKGITTIHSVIKNELIKSVFSNSLLNMSAEPDVWALSAGLSLIVQRSMEPALVFSISNAVFERNRSPLAGCIYASFFVASVSVSLNIRDSEFTVCEGGAAGGAIYMSFGISSFVVESLSHTDGNITVSISNCTFNSCVAAWGGAIGIVGSVNFHYDMTSDPGMPPAAVNIASSNFTSNSAFAGSAIALWNSKFHGSQRRFGVELFLYNDYFSENIRQVTTIPFSPGTSDSDTSLNGAVIYAESSILNGFGLLMFEKNIISCVVLIRSIFLAEGCQIKVKDNLAIEGTGLEVRSESLFLDRNSTIVIERNQALWRGAAVAQVVASASPLRTVTPSCWIHFENIAFARYNLSERVANGLNSNISLLNNVAGVSGSTLFSSVPPNCPWFLQDTISSTIDAIRNETFPIFVVGDVNIPRLLNNSSSVGIGLGSIHLLHPKPPLMVMPGEEFSIVLNVTDELGFPSPSVLGIGFLNEFTFRGVYHTINDEVLTHVTGRNSAVRVRIFGPTNSTGYNVSYQVFSVDGFTFSETLFAVLTDCREGFLFDNETKSCMCDPQLNGNDAVSCNVNGTIAVSSSKWVGRAQAGKDFVIRQCIFDFCRSGNIPIKNLSNDTEQCANNRSGILCGKCRDSFSRVFGSLRCLQCQSYYLFSIIAFVIVGVVLIFVLLCTRVTFTSGILGGIVFYSNVVSIFSQQLFPTSFGSNSNGAYILLSFFSVNIGFEMCFYDGMDSLALTGLHLVFPVYLFCLAILAIVVAHYFPKIPLPKSNILIEVLVTVVLISYTAVLEAVTEMLGVVILRGETARWLQDPNVMYGTDLHLFYLILAIVIILIFILPIPIIIIFPNIFSRFKVYNKIHPFLYSLQVPFKSKWRRWEGIRIVIRILLLILANLSYVISMDGITTFLLSEILLITVMAFQAYVHPYEAEWLNVLDLFYMFNLVVLMLVSFTLTNRAELLLPSNNLVENEDINRIIAVTLLMSITLLVFLVSIFVYLTIKFHWKKKLMSLSLVKKMHAKIKSFKYSRYEQPINDCNDDDHVNSYEMQSDLDSSSIGVSQWSGAGDSEDERPAKNLSHLRESLLEIEHSDSVW